MLHVKVDTIKLGIIKTLRQSKSDIKDVKAVNIHKMVHQVYKGSAGELRAAAKDLVSFWKTQIKAAIAHESSAPAKGEFDGKGIEEQKKESKKNNAGKGDKGKNPVKNGKPEVPVISEEEIKAKLRESIREAITSAIQDAKLGEEIEKGN